jgi:uncharacterized protein YeaO (DUF488 family)
MDAFRKEDIEKYLKELNKKLKEKNEQGELIVAGGASLSLVYGARRTTHDIDALFEPKESLNKMVEDIAEEYGLEKDWLNDGVKGFFTKEMTHSEILKYSNLIVSSIDAECLLALKLTSARPLNDMDDSIILMKHIGIKKEKELFDLIEKYIPNNKKTALAHFFTIEAFQKYSEKYLKKISIKERLRLAEKECNRLKEISDKKNDRKKGKNDRTR